MRMLVLLLLLLLGADANKRCKIPVLIYADPPADFVVDETWQAIGEPLSLDNHDNAFINTRVIGLVISVMQLWSDSVTAALAQRFAATCNFYQNATQETSIVLDVLRADPISYLMNKFITTLTSERNETWFRSDWCYRFSVGWILAPSSLQILNQRITLLLSGIYTFITRYYRLNQQQKQQQVDERSILVSLLSELKLNTIENVQKCVQKMNREQMKYAWHTEYLATHPPPPPPPPPCMLNGRNEQCVSLLSESKLQCNSHNRHGRACSYNEKFADKSVIDCTCIE